MVSDVPVTAWQSIPSSTRNLATPTRPEADCRSASNDARLLLPTAAMKPNIACSPFVAAGWKCGDLLLQRASGVAITADGRRHQRRHAVQQRVRAPKPTTLRSMDPLLGGGPGIASKNSGEIYDFDMNAGDVIELIGSGGRTSSSRIGDLSGSVIQATKPVQVTRFQRHRHLPRQHGLPMQITWRKPFCPPEVIGKKYIVVPPPREWQLR